MHAAVTTRSETQARLDFAFIACILIIPHSYLMYLSSSEFGASPLRRVPLFLLPAIVLGLKLMRPVPKERMAVDRVVVSLWLAILLQGVLMALLRTSYPGNVLSYYGQYFYWFVLVALFIAANRQEGVLHIFELMRRYFVIVAAIAWTFTILYLLFREQLPHTSVLLPDADSGSLLLGENYFLSVVYSHHSVFGLDVPRFTFLYKEPRILGMQLSMGIVLQLGYVRAHWREWHSRQRWGGVLTTLMVVGALVWAHSVNGYTFAFFLLLNLLAIALLGRKFWPRFRAVYAGAIAAGALAVAVLFTVVVRNVELNDLSSTIQQTLARSSTDANTEGVDVTDFVGKPTEFVAGYVLSYLSAPRALIAFPFGTGIMNRDNERYMSDFGIPTTQGGTLLQFVTQNAGVIGLLLFGVLLWRMFGRMRTIVTTASNEQLRYICVLGGFLIAVSSLFVDIISMSAFSVLVFGSILNLPLEA